MEDSRFSTIRCAKKVIPWHCQKKLMNSLSNLTLNHSYSTAAYKRKINSVLKNNNWLARSLAKCQCDLAEKENVLIDNEKNLDIINFSKIKLHDMAENMKKATACLDETIALLALQVLNSSPNGIQSKVNFRENFKKKLKNLDIDPIEEEAECVENMETDLSDEKEKEISFTGKLTGSTEKKSKSPSNNSSKSDIVPKSYKSKTVSGKVWEKNLTRNGGRKSKVSPTSSSDTICDNTQKFGEHSEISTARNNGQKKNSNKKQVISDTCHNNASRNGPQDYSEFAEGFTNINNEIIQDVMNDISDAVVSKDSASNNRISTGKKSVHSKIQKLSQRVSSQSVPKKLESVLNIEPEESTLSVVKSISEQFQITGSSRKSVIPKMKKLTQRVSSQSSNRVPSKLQSVSEINELEQSNLSVVVKESISESIQITQSSRKTMYPTQKKLQQKVSRQNQVTTIKNSSTSTTSYLAANKLASVAKLHESDECPSVVNKENVSESNVATMNSNIVCFKKKDVSRKVSIKQKLPAAPVELGSLAALHEPEKSPVTELNSSKRLFTDDVYDVNCTSGMNWGLNTSDLTLNQNGAKDFNICDSQSVENCISDLTQCDTVRKSTSEKTSEIVQFQSVESCNVSQNDWIDTSEHILEKSVTETQISKTVKSCSNKVTTIKNSLSSTNAQPSAVNSEKSKKQVKFCFSDSLEREIEHEKKVKKLKTKAPRKRPLKQHKTENTLHANYVPPVKRSALSDNEMIRCGEETFLVTAEVHQPPGGYRTAKRKNQLLSKHDQNNLQPSVVLTDIFQANKDVIESIFNISGRQHNISELDIENQPVEAERCVPITEVTKTANSYNAALGDDLQSNFLGMSQAIASDVHGMQPTIVLTDILKSRKNVFERVSCSEKINNFQEIELKEKRSISNNVEDKMTTLPATLHYLTVGDNNVVLKLDDSTTQIAGSRRRNKILSYKEPSLNVKLRRCI